MQSMYKWGHDLVIEASDTISPTIDQNRVSVFWGMVCQWMGPSDIQSG